MGDSRRMDTRSTSTMVLFGEFEAFHDDTFDGSVNEHQIFTEVLFGNDNSSSSKRRLVNGVGKFESDHATQMDLSFSSNNETSALTSLAESYSVLGDSSEKPGVGCPAEDLTMFIGSSSPMKLPVEDLSDAKPWTGKVSDTFASSRGVVSCTSQLPSEFDCQVTCRLVESSNEVVTSSVYMLKRNIKMDRVSELGEKDIPKYKVSNSDDNDQKEMVLSGAIASPDSQECYMTKLLVNPSISALNKSGTLRPAKPKWKDSCFVELDETELSMIRDTTNDPRPLLRYHVHQLFRAAGWVIGRRKRTSKFNGIGEYVFKSPEGRPIREFHRAWISCGEQLLFYADYAVQTNDCKLWTDMTQFMSDLSSTVSEINEQLGNMQPTAALIRAWCLLDPFAHVVFIDKSIRLLKEGKVVKAKRSFIINSLAPSDANNNYPSCISNDSEVDQRTSKDQSDDSQKSANEASIQDKSSLPACRSRNSTCDQLVEVPLSSDYEHISLGVSEEEGTTYDRHSKSRLQGSLAGGSNC